ncbi:MAG: hypothetical protein IJT79_08935 [Ruminococcus sp.]|nr:hypothetical protein [Ruminococcus sp.]
MRSLKRPLSILIAALMLVSVMVIAPVTASATVSFEVTKWVKGENITRDGNSALYSFKDLFENFKFTKVKKNATPSWDNSTVYNQTVNYSLHSGGAGYYINCNDQAGSFATNCNTYALNGYGDGDNFYGKWYNYGSVNSNDGYCIDAQYAPFADMHTTVDWYAYTWETFTLTEQSAVYGANGNLQYYTDENNDGRYFVADGDSYKEVNRSDVFFDYVTANGKGFNTTKTFSFDDADPLKDTLAESGLTGAKDLQTIGVQTSTGRVESGFRFLTVVKSDILDAADDFGYVVVKTTQGLSDVKGKEGQLDVSTIDASAKYSCKGTENDFAGNYGSSDLSSTDYKYISCFVKDPDSDNTVVSRFYVKVDGNTYFYAQYTPDNSTWYNGCAYALS